MLILDPTTIRFCAEVARSSAAGTRALPDARAHHDCAAAALVVLAEELEAMLPAPEVKAA